MSTSPATCGAAAGDASLAAGVCAAENAAAQANARAANTCGRSWRRKELCGVSGADSMGGDVAERFRARAGTLYVVATPLGNLRDVTLRALDVLATADVIAAEDTRVTAKLLSHYGIAARTLALHAHNEAGRAEAVVARLAAGESVALVTDAGTPAVSDPGARLVRAAHDAGCPVVPVPGASA